MKLKASTTRALLLFSTFISSLILISTWVIASPPGGSPDEPVHFVTIYCTSENYSSSCIDGISPSIDLNPVKAISSCYLFQRDRGVACEKTNIFEKLSKGNSESLNKYAENNYYKVLSYFTSDFYLISLLSMRLFNGAIFLVVFFLSVYLLPIKHRQLFVFSTFVVLIPLGLYLITSINTSSWMIIGAIGLWASLYSMLYEFKHEENKLIIIFMKILLFLFSSFLLVSSRFDGVYFFMIIIFSISIIFIINPVSTYLGKYLNQTLIKLISFVVIVSSTIYILFQMRNRAQVTFLESDFDFLDRLFENSSKLPHLLLGPMGTWGLGWLDVWLTPLTFIVMTFVFVGLVFVSLRHLDFPHSISAILLTISVISLPIFILMFSGYRVGEWVQPRYLLPLYFPLLGVLLFSSVNRILLNKLQISFIYLLVSAAHSAALFTNLERYIRGQNTYSYDLTVGLEWWWDQLPSPNLIWGFGSASFLFLFALLIHLTRRVRANP